MKSEVTFIEGDRDSDDDSEINVSESEEDSASISDGDSSVSDTDDDSDAKDVSAAGSSGTSTQQENDIKVEGDKEEEEEEDEDEVIKAILKSKELHRDHPPTIILEDSLTDICFHPSQDIIALASITGDVLVYKYNNEENKLVSTQEIHEKACRDIEFSEDGSILYSTGKDKAIMLSDFETEKLIRVIENAHEHPIYTVTLLDNNVFATGDDEGVVKLWDRRQQDNNPIFSLKEMDDYVSSMVTNDDKQYLVCASGDGTLTTLNIRGKKLHVRTEDYPEELTCLGLFKHGRKILAGGSKGTLYLFNWGEFGLHIDEVPSLTKKSINCMIPITENVVVTAGEDKMLRATHLFPNRRLGIAGQHDLSVEFLDICNDGSIIGSYAYDNSVRFWNISYFENSSELPSVKGGKQKQLKHNLPSSKQDNASDFFADL